jgi:serine/threonine protein kinase/Flp pilus assembly protein TadD
MTDREDRLMTLFSQALDCESPAERVAFLDAACSADPELRQRVEALLEAHGQVGRFLEPRNAVSQEAATAVGGQTTVTSGMVISGRYKLLEEIGEGGMGHVWMAQQTEPVKRDVAVKLIKPGMDSRQVLARFEAERQALALMDHPNIARVLDAGATDAGRPFFVMELVKGVPITKYCDDHRLNPRDRLVLFAQVCSAVQHAHQKGVIHRDLKPSNVLVAPYDGVPVPKVIDFGVAKAAGRPLTDKTLVTGLGAIVGTPEYMSPEQAELNNKDIDTRSDVYSLGVLLYELLTGTTPLTRMRLKETALLEVLRLVREEEPPRPSTRLAKTDELPSIAAVRGVEPARLSQLLRGELDWIAMKALEKDRSRRYESANGFAQDIQRYLVDEPVLACPPTAAYRLRKFAQRHRRRLAAVAVVGVLLAAAVGSLGWAMLDRAQRAEEKRHQQSQAGSELELSLQRAELFQGQGKRAEALAALERADLLSGAAPANAAQSERRAALLERLEADVRDREFIDRYEAIRLNVQSRVDVQRSRYNFEGGLPEIRDALTRFGIAVGLAAPGDVAARIRGRPEPARSYLAAALDECLRLSPKEDEAARQWLLSVLEAADQDPWRARARRAVAKGDRVQVERLARDVDAWKQPPSFLLLIARSMSGHPAPTRLEFLRRMRQAYPADLWANHELAFELQLVGRKAEAVRYFTATIALRPDNPGLYVNRGGTLAAAGEFDEAITDLRRAIELAPNYTTAWTNLSSALEATGQVKEGLEASLKATELDPKLPLAWSNLAHAHTLVHQFQKALDDCDVALKLDPTFVLAWANRGGAHLQLGHFDAAITACNEALRLDPNEAVSLANRGGAYAGLGRYEQALEDCAAAVKLEPGRASLHYSLGYILDKLGRQQECIAAYREAIKLQDDYAEAHSNLAVRLVMVGRFAEALAHLRRAEEISSKIPGWPYPTARMRQDTERLVELDKRLPAFLDGSARAASAGERIELATLCTYKRQYQGAAKFFAETFAADPKLAADLRTGHRYNAACAAALAGVGQGEDARQLDDTERARLRELALGWLRADLEALGAVPDTAPEADRSFALRWMEHCLADSDFAGVRGSESLAKLPEPQRKAWQRLWGDVQEQLVRTQRSVTPKKKTPAK